MFIPHTDSEREEMLKTIGVEKLSDLFQDVPEKFRFPELNLPDALTEMEALAQAQELAAANETTQDLACFLGAGSYNHYIPAIVDAIIRRGEFLTAYTPYQPEISQGTLQAVFEYQSLVCALTGMDVANASHYDGSTAAAEAGVLAYHHFRGKRKKFVLSPSVHPDYRNTLRTYLSGRVDLEFVGDEESTDPLANPDELARHIDINTAMVLVQYPDFFGRIYDLSALSKKAHEAGAIFVVAVNPLSLGLLKPPSEFDADIVVGDGQPLGLPMSFGGPYLGLFATKNDFFRKISGRLVGETVDEQGRRGYVLTLTAREQHIRREKATSNICTNQGLMALASSVYMSALGKHGLRKVSQLNYHKAHYAAECIAAIPGFKLVSKEPFFNEFLVECPMPVSELNEYLLEYGILGGYNLNDCYPSMKNTMLLAVTEMNLIQDIDFLCEALREVSHD